MPTLRLAEMLEKRKMTKYRFAKLMKAEYKNIGRWFKPGYDPKISTMAAWARVLRCRIRDLYKEQP
jgi:DNA-binding XRE family transcriptional regulator